MTPAALLAVALAAALGGSMKTDDADRVKTAADAHPDRAFGPVARWAAATGSCRVTLADGTEWTLAGDDRVEKYRALLDFSRDEKEPLLLFVDKKSRAVGLVCSTLVGTPEVDGPDADGKRVNVGVPPSMRVFRLHKDRPWFRAASDAIAAAEKAAAAGKAAKVRIAYDSETSEIVDVRAEKE